MKNVYFRERTVLPNISMNVICSLFCKNYTRNARVWKGTGKIHGLIPNVFSEKSKDFVHKLTLIIFNKTKTISIKHVYSYDSKKASTAQFLKYF